MKIVVLLCVLFVAAVARLNLPENRVDGRAVFPQPENALEKIAADMLSADAVADWQYRDFVFVKFACSKRLKTGLIGMPFQQWQKMDKGDNICTDMFAYKQ